MIAASTSPVALLRRGLGVQGAYCVRLGRLTADYVRTMATLALAPGEDAVAPTAVAADPIPATPAPPAIVLEAETGTTAAARFLVENHLAEPISTPVSVSPFVSEQGHEVDVRLEFEPALVTLGPREQLLVHVGVLIGDELADAGGYRGVLGVPGLPGTELVILVRRMTPHLQRNGAR